MLGTGIVTIGWLSLFEEDVVPSTVDNTGYRSITIASFSVVPQFTLAQAKQHQEDMLGLVGQLVPITFSDKSDLDGLYQVTDVSTSYENWDDTVGRVDYSITALMFGPDNAVDVESGVVAVVRQNDFTLTGETWHAPPIGAYGYYTGSTHPSVLSRVGEDGTVTVYRNIPSGVSPRWGIAATNWTEGGARVTVNGTPRVSTNIVVPVSGWTLENSIVKIGPGSTGTFTVSHWDSGAWVTKEWNVSVGGTGAPDLGTFDAATIITNTPEMCTLRLLKSKSPGRSTLDLTLRRGSRFVECYLKTDSSATLSLWLDASETLTNNTASGYVVATSNDANGNRLTAGTAHSCTYNSNLGFYVTSSTEFDFYIGLVFNGGTAVSGDAATDLLNQYVGALAVTTNYVPR